MARFYGEVTGQARTEASRIGSESSGIEGHIRGWHIGGEVICKAQCNNNELDICHIYATSGSNGYQRLLLATIEEKENAKKEIKFNEKETKSFELLKELMSFSNQRTKKYKEHVIKCLSFLKNP